VHAGLAVAGDQAGELERAGLRKAPQHLARLARIDADGIRLGVLHVRHLAHHRGVLVIVLDRGEPELVRKRAFVLQHEADLLAFFDLEPVRREFHGAVALAHHHRDGARRLCPVAGHAGGEMRLVMGGSGSDRGNEQRRGER
jgi:hypothetical protein